MTRAEFMDSVKKAKVDGVVEQQIKDVYCKTEIPELILKIFSTYKKSELFDENESRTISLSELLCAEERIGVPFRSIQVIPVVDLGDNDYIVYDGKEKAWFVYNIVDEIFFDASASFEELFRRN